MLKYNMFIRRLFLMLVASLIVYLSHQPALKPPIQWFAQQDKVFHLLEFGGLGLALVLNHDLFGKKHKKKYMFIYGSIWAILDEIHQYFVPGRFSSIMDVTADIIGIYLSVLLFYKFFSIKDKHIDVKNPI